MRVAAHARALASQRCPLIRDNRGRHRPVARTQLLKTAQTLHRDLRVASNRNALTSARAHHVPRANRCGLYKTNIVFGRNTTFSLSLSLLS